MVSRKQHIVTLQRALWAVVITVLGGFHTSASTDEGGKKFYADDPLRKEPTPRPVHKVEVRKVDDIYDFVDNMYVTPHREGKAAKRGPHTALNTNTLGEVPDSAWYTNRHALRMSVAELRRGPGNSAPPMASDSWRITGAKSDGVTPGFVIEDGRKNRYVLKLDPPEFPEMCSAADVIGSKFFYALGYNTPENYIVHFRRENLEIPAGVTWRGPDGKKRPFTGQALDKLLKPLSKEADGSYRALASRWIAGKVVGPFSYRGTRSDDPNDTVPHEDRRELRGLAVFAAWLNHHDTRSINSMDSLVTEDGVQYLKHYLMDFGSILGSAGYGPKMPWQGHEYTIDRRQAVVQMATFGFYPPRWVRSDYPKLTGAGLFDAWAFDPMSWKANYPNPAFLLMDREDAFWAARQVAAFSDDEIRALVETGEFSDPRATGWITECLIKRRDKIAEAWFSRVLPLDKFRVVDGRLAFEDLGSNRGINQARMYEVSWSSFNNARAPVPIPAAYGTTIPLAPNDAEYLAAKFACSGATGGSCANPLNVYLRRAGSVFEVVGIDR